LLGELFSSGCALGSTCGARPGDGALLVTALFMTTRFSFSGAHAWASDRMARLKSGKAGHFAEAQTRWHAWREEREQQRMRLRVEESRLSGRKPSAQLIEG